MAHIQKRGRHPLNEAYKTIKFKLEGPQSKVRIQTDAEKCFVMLQAAIGQYFFGEFALRQQMSYMIDGASQVLSAVEQYAKEGSRNRRRLFLCGQKSKRRNLNGMLVI